MSNNQDLKANNQDMIAKNLGLNLRHNLLIIVMMIHHTALSDASDSPPEDNIQIPICCRSGMMESQIRGAQPNGWMLGRSYNLFKRVSIEQRATCKVNSRKDSLKSPELIQQDRILSYLLCDLPSESKAFHSGL